MHCTCSQRLLPQKTHQPPPQQQPPFIGSIPNASAQAARPAGKRMLYERTSEYLELNPGLDLDTAELEARRDFREVNEVHLSEKLTQTFEEMKKCYRLRYVLGRLNLMYELLKIEEHYNSLVADGKVHPANLGLFDSKIVGRMRSGECKNWRGETRALGSQLTSETNRKGGSANLHNSRREGAGGRIRPEAPSHGLQRLSTRDGVASGPCRILQPPMEKSQTAPREMQQPEKGQMFQVIGDGKPGMTDESSRASQEEEETAVTASTSRENTFERTSSINANPGVFNGPTAAAPLPRIPTKRGIGFGRFRMHSVPGGLGNVVTGMDETMLLPGNQKLPTGRTQTAFTAGGLENLQEKPSQPLSLCTSPAAGPAHTTETTVGSAAAERSGPAAFRNEAQHSTASIPLLRGEHGVTDNPSVPSGAMHQKCPNVVQPGGQFVESQSVRLLIDPSVRQLAEAASSSAARSVPGYNETDACQVRPDIAVPGQPRGVDAEAIPAEDCCHAHCQGVGQESAAPAEKQLREGCTSHLVLKRDVPRLCSYSRDALSTISGGPPPCFPNGTHR
ncbi:hypothetical protein NCLIV_049310 [Neospora caninum Liverpool]|uniref:Uncharacterized protein n=1 Tax=Neospora caninum (strain Liverpool) TaxID=572307 RepID=F0VKA1_NEOCL|nr:hypothetical protein NCLIV_049310 [Neospora caninum Liverpool]CBZ54502.1 hypothetical protein NCLIV_049310 [Neospora caninum Liverpool]|eukprot:XP_003884532.1 hypothetical protein NCLIV_049310 [Neospora caninum Liverpool]